MLGVSILPYSTILIFDLELFQLCGFLLFFNFNFIICSFETHSVVKDVVIPYPLHSVVNVLQQRLEDVKCQNQ
jgi:hypothetical protein